MVILVNFCLLTLHQDVEEDSGPTEEQPASNKHPDGTR